MKHLITKLLLVMICVLSASLSADAMNLYLSGNANSMEETSTIYGWNMPALELKEDASGDVYFWVSGEFAVSKSQGVGSDWGKFNDARIKITGNDAFDMESHVNSDMGASMDSKLYVKMHIENGNASVKVQNTPFESVGPVVLEDLYIGGSWNNSWYAPAQIKTEENAYSDFTITAQGTFQFRFYVDAAVNDDDRTGWMGAPSNNYECNADGQTTYSTTSNTGEVFNVKAGAGVYVVKVKSFDKANKKVTFTIARQGDLPKDVTYWFRSNVNDSGWTNDFQLVPGEDGTTVFRLSNIAGKQFGIQGAENGNQTSWYVPTQEIGNEVRTYTLQNVQGQQNNNGRFSADAGNGEYTFVLVWNNGVPSQLRVNPPATSSYNNTLFVGIASSNRHQISYSNGTYEEYKFYVTAEDLQDSEFGFRFYSEPNGGVWMGGEEQTHDLEFGKEYTTTGIKRYFINDEGAYGISVKSYDPEKKVVVFVINKLDTDIVSDPLYIGGTWNNSIESGTQKARITSSKGQYKPFEIKVGPNCEFRFYSEEYGGQSMGPVYTDLVVVDGRGTLAYTTVATDRRFRLAEAGTYQINVSEYVKSENKVTFTATKIEGGVEEPAEAPATLYMRNSRDDWKNVMAMTYDEESRTFSAKVQYNSDEVFAFHFIEKDAANWSDRGLIFYPDGNGNTRLSANTPMGISNISHRDSDPNSGWDYVSKTAEEITIVVDFSKSVPTVTVVAAAETPTEKNYFFIGDLNEWFSNEFDGDLDQTDIYGDKIERGINAKKFEATKSKWQFEYAGDGWYRFSGFPSGLLTGHFQIIGDKATWNPAENEVYSHVVVVNEDEIKEGKMSTYRAFKMNRITRSDIINQNEYRIRKRPNTKDAPGSNLGTQCNAVEEAVLWFYPGSDNEVPRIRIEGTPKDYFIFYNMEDAADAPDYKIGAEGEQNSEYWVRAAINSGKPNTNNYFLAGIKYGDMTLPFYDINGNSGAHMNLNEGIDLAPYDLKNLTEAELNDLFFGQQDIVSSIMTEKKLPNGRDISGYDNVWVAKIPSGFENPAGTKYNMTFNKAMTKADRTSSRTLTPRHLYFFPQVDGLHVHINTEAIEELDNVERVDVAYRVYKTDYNYNTIAVLHGSDVENGRATRTLHERGSVLPLTAESASKEIGWYELVNKSDELWGSPSDKCGYPDTNWMVSWDEAGSENADTKDFRREVPYDDNSAFVQFRIHITLKDNPARVNAREAAVKSYTVYVPDRVDVANDKYHFSFDNKDLYVKAGYNGDAVWTEVKDILDEINGNVDPSSTKAVYYNLQGVRVDNPTEGIYIRVCGNKSEKVMF